MKKLLLFLLIGAGSIFAGKTKQDEGKAPLLNNSPVTMQEYNDFVGELQRLDLDDWFLKVWAGTLGWVCGLSTVLAFTVHKNFVFVTSALAVLLILYPGLNFLRTCCCNNNSQRSRQIMQTFLSKIRNGIPVEHRVITIEPRRVNL